MTRPDPPSKPGGSPWGALLPTLQGHEPACTRTTPTLSFRPSGGASPSALVVNLRAILSVTDAAPGHAPGPLNQVYVAVLLSVHRSGRPHTIAALSPPPAVPPLPLPVEAARLVDRGLKGGHQIDTGASELTAAAARGERGAVRPIVGCLPGLRDGSSGKKGRYHDPQHGSSDDRGPRLKVAHCIAEERGHHPSWPHP
jgi:hypothetical protein